MDDNGLEVNPKEITLGKEDNKCAPGKKFKNYSCIELKILIKIVEAFNKYNETNKIKLYPGYEIINEDKYKLYLLHKLTIISLSF